MEAVKNSKRFLKRLPAYLAHLRSLPENSYVSATSIAKALELGDVQVRKDLAQISETGRRRTGRSREQLIRDIEMYLDFASKNGAVIVGVGKLGGALLEYGGFEEFGLNIMAGFDIHPGTDHTPSGKPVYAMSKLDAFCRRYDVCIGVITVPADQAQRVCDTMVACGITAIWNFAPVHLKVPDHVVVQNENLAASLTELRVMMRNRETIC